MRNKILGFLIFGIVITIIFKKCYFRADKNRKALNEGESLIK